jgi:hypothetical protein
MHLKTCILLSFFFHFKIKIHSKFLVPYLPQASAEVKVRSENGPLNCHVGEIGFLLERIYWNHNDCTITIKIISIPIPTEEHVRHR